MTGHSADYAWVACVQTVDAEERDAVKALDQNPGWRLLHVGTGKGGQTTLTYGWPAPEGFQIDSSGDAT